MPDASRATSPSGEPAEGLNGDRVAALFAFMMFVVPAIGVPHEQLLQDSLKSMVVSFVALGAALLFFWQRSRSTGLTGGIRWHALMWFPLALMAYALGSMVWSHAYLAGVEAIRWFIFGLLVWLGMNTLSRERLPALAWGIHMGALVASLWTALQFWVDFRYFPQGPNPASTFVNRNFFAEYVVCTLPFSAWLLARTKSFPQIAALSYSVAFNVVALLMTGTRSALTAMWLLLFLVLPVVGFVYRRQLAFSTWNPARRMAAMGIALVTVIGFGLVNTGNPKIAGELHGRNALERGIFRTVSVVTNSDEFRTGSLSVRLLMWKATGRMIQDRPLSGVGAGAWEVHAPLYQTAGSQIETDYYAHNEFLQLLAEYGLAGWAALLALFSCLGLAAWRTFWGPTAHNREEGGENEEGAIRAVALSSLLALFMVSNAGFPWRLASTGALFAICLGVLAASDARMGLRSRLAAWALPLPPRYARVLAMTTVLLIALATFIAEQAAECEQKLVHAVQLALSISQSGDPNNPLWNPVKKEMLTLVRQGIAINPHYRKLTPIVADELARWGDWKDAIWIWESVVSSRPYIVAILSNIARGYAQTGDTAKAFEVLARCKEIQPQGPAVRSLEIILLSRTGRDAEAMQLAQQSLNENIYDRDVLNAAWTLGMRHGNYALAIQGMELRNQKWPAEKVDGQLKLGSVYLLQKDETRALASYRAALDATPDSLKDLVRQRIPPALRSRL